MERITIVGKMDDYDNPPPYQMLFELQTLLDANEEDYKTLGFNTYRMMKKVLSNIKAVRASPRFVHFIVLLQSIDKTTEIDVKRSNARSRSKLSWRFRDSWGYRLPLIVLSSCKPLDVEPFLRPLHPFELV